MGFEWMAVMRWIPRPPDPPPLLLCEMPRLKQKPGFVEKTRPSTRTTSVAEFCFQMALGQRLHLAGGLAAV